MLRVASLCCCLRVGKLFTDRKERGVRELDAGGAQRSAAPEAKQHEERWRKSKDRRRNPGCNTPARIGRRRTRTSVLIADDHPRGPDATNLKPRTSATNLKPRTSPMQRPSRTLQVIKSRAESRARVADDVRRSLHFAKRHEVLTRSERIASLNLRWKAGDESFSRDRRPGHV